MNDGISRNGGPAVRIMVAALLALLTLHCIGCSSQQPKNAPESDQTSTGAPAPTATEFRGGKFDASGVAFVPGTDQVLIVDNNLKDAVVAMPVDAQGNQVGDTRSVPLGIKVDDPEDITSDGNYFYVIGSQSKPKKRSDIGLVRFKYDASGKASDVQTISGLGDLVLQKVPEIAADGSKDSADDGLNIEGLARDPHTNRILLGLRSPLVNGNAVVVPLTLPDPEQPFNIEGVKVETPITLPLDDHGIRSIEYIDKLGAYLIISGGTETEKHSEFALWRWDGTGRPEMIEPLERAIRPEGITEVRIGGSDFIFVVADAGYYFRLNRP